MLRIHPALVGVTVAVVLGIAIGIVLGPISCDVVSRAGRWGCTPDGSEQRWLYAVAGVGVAAVGIAAALAWQAARRRAGIPIQAPDSPNRGIGAHMETATLAVPPDRAFATLREVLVRLGYRIQQEDAGQFALVAFRAGAVKIDTRLAARVDPATDGGAMVTVEASPAFDAKLMGNSVFRKKARAVIDALRAAL